VEQRFTPAVAEGEKGWWNVGPKVLSRRRVLLPLQRRSHPPLGLPEQKPIPRLMPPLPYTTGQTHRLPANWEESRKALSNKDRKAFVRRVYWVWGTIFPTLRSTRLEYWVVDYPAKPRRSKALKNKLEQEGPKDICDRQYHRNRHADVAGEVNSILSVKGRRSDSGGRLTISRYWIAGKEIPKPSRIQKRAEISYVYETVRRHVRADRYWLPADVEAFAKHTASILSSLLETRREKIKSKSALAMLSGKHVPLMLPPLRRKSLSQVAQQRWQSWVSRLARDCSHS